jgi:hypothetical protein
MQIFFRSFLHALANVVRELKTKDFYIGLVFRILSVSFIAVFWLYLRSVTDIEISVERVIAYFFSIAAFQYLYNYDFANVFTEMLDKELDESQLAPGGVLAFAFRKKLLPLVSKSLLLGVFLFAYLLISGLVAISALPIVTLAFILANIYYFYISVALTIVGKYLNWSEYMGFSLRFIGFTWNGSYIPFIFMTGMLGSIVKYTPFMPSGLFLQPIWSPSFEILPFLPYVAIGILFWSIITHLLVKSYLLMKRS